MIFLHKHSNLVILLDRLPAQDLLTVTQKGGGERIITRTDISRNYEFIGWL